MELSFEPIIKRFDLLASPVKKIIENWEGNTPIDEIQVAEINPKYMGVLSHVSTTTYHQIPVLTV